MAVNEFKADFIAMFAKKGVKHPFSWFQYKIKKEVNDRDWGERLLPWKHLFDATLPYILGGFLPYTVSKYVPFLFLLQPLSDLSDRKSNDPADKPARFSFH